MLRDDLHHFFDCIPFNLGGRRRYEISSNGCCNRNNIEHNSGPNIYFQSGEIWWFWAGAGC